MRPLYRAGQRDTCTVRPQPVFIVISTKSLSDVKKALYRLDFSVFKFACSARYSPALKKWGYTGYGPFVIPLVRNSVRFFVSQEVLKLDS